MWLWFLPYSSSPVRISCVCRPQLKVDVVEGPEKTTRTFEFRWYCHARGWLTKIKVSKTTAETTKKVLNAKILIFIAAYKKNLLIRQNQITVCVSPESGWTGVLCRRVLRTPDFNFLSSKSEEQKLKYIKHFAESLQLEIKRFVMMVKTTKNNKDSVDAYKLTLYTAIWMKC